MLRGDSLVAFAEIGLRKKMQQFVGTRAANDPVGGKTVTPGDGMAKFVGAAIGIERETVRGAEKCLMRLRARPERRFVRRELVDLLRAFRAGAAADIGCDFEDAALRLGTFHLVLTRRHFHG